MAQWSARKLVGYGAGWRNRSATALALGAMRRATCATGLLLVLAAPVNAQNCIDSCWEYENGTCVHPHRECTFPGASPQSHGPVYAAIAYGAVSTAYGRSEGKSGSASTERVALRYCGQHGNDCKIVATFAPSTKGCTAVAAVKDKGRFVTGQDSTLDRAKAAATNICRAQLGGPCELEVWGCGGK
jgi:hypothetical protein